LVTVTCSLVRTPGRRAGAAWIAIPAGVATLNVRTQLTLPEPSYGRSGCVTLGS
jgi:hypothetical protein